MFERMKEFADKLRAKLENEEYIRSLSKHIKKINKEMTDNFNHDLRVLSNPISSRIYNREALDNKAFVNQTIFPYFLKLLAIAVTYHMQNELDELLTFGRELEKEAKEGNYLLGTDFKGRSLIDRPLCVDRATYSPDTLLGLAGAHGYLDTVRYLVEQKANVNAYNLLGNTPLVKTVRGDSYPIHHSSYGTQHDEVAQYLIEQKAELKEPLEDARKAKPPMLPFFSNAVRKNYLADKVRPVLEKAEEEILARELEKMNGEPEKKPEPEESPRGLFSI